MLAAKVAEFGALIEAKVRTAQKLAARGIFRL